jgi:YHS domain-containing protein
MEETWGGQDYSDPNDPPVRSLDPVCGVAIEEAKAAGHTGYAGQMYYFCSSDCQKQFQSDPGLYIGQLRSV